MFGSAFDRYGRERRQDARLKHLFTPDRSGEIVAIDTETTSLDPATAEPIAIGAVKLRDGRILASQSFHALIRPEGPMEVSGIKVHGLRRRDVAAGSTLVEAMDRFIDFIGGRPLLGYYLEFDIAILNRALVRWLDARYPGGDLEIRLPNRRIEVSSLYYDWRRKTDPSVWQHGHVDLSFDRILKALDLPPMRRHDARRDAMAAGLIYLALAARGAARDRPRG